jgi:hypothetical protein
MNSLPSRLASVYAARRAAVEDLLRTPGGYILSNNELSRLLGAGVVGVRRVRRELESSGAVPKVNCRMSRRGYYIDVSRLTEVLSRKAI